MNELITQLRNQAASEMFDTADVFDLIEETQCSKCCSCSCGGNDNIDNPDF